jgi:hypothetical protein
MAMAMAATESEEQHQVSQTEVVTLSIGSLTSKRGHEAVQVPVSGIVADVIIQLPCLEGCSGFLATAKKRIMDDEDYDDYYGGSDSDCDPCDKPVSSGLAERLVANGGVLLEPSNALSCYGIDSTTCSEVTLFAVYDVVAKKPTVFKKDIEGMGFGENIWRYVKLNHEDKELVAAREYFRAPLFPWLQGRVQDETGLSQTIALSMDDNFPDEHRAILTVQIVPEGDDLLISCTNLAGDLICSVKLAGDNLIPRLQSCLCDVMHWASVALWNESELVSESDDVSKYSLLTAEQNLHHGAGKRVLPVQ